jgi:hypothetical protein
MMDLTKLEFAVISYLHERQGTVVERSELMHDVWGYDQSRSSVMPRASRQVPLAPTGTPLGARPLNTSVSSARVERRPGSMAAAM